MTDCVSHEFITPKANAAGFLSHIAGNISARIKRRRDMRQLREIHSLSPHLLKDIGVRRGDVVWAANLPVELDAVKALKKETGHR